MDSEIATGTSGRQNLYLFATVLPLFFLSGLTALAYEVVWQRMLSLVMGSTLQATSAVLAAFMAGLGIGSLAFGRILKRRSNGLRLYAILEIFTGLYAIATPLFLNHLDFLLGPIYRSLAGDQPLFGAARFLAASLVLFPPAFAMGGTLPALARHISAAAGAPRRKIGLLYAVNTMGAVAGCLLTGFITIMIIGIRSTIFCAAALNILIGILAWLISSPEAEQKAAESPGGGPTLSGWRRTSLIACFGLSGFTALALEVVWTRTLIFGLFQGSSTYAFTVMLAAFLLGLGSGSLAASLLPEKSRGVMPLLSLAEILVGAGCIASIPLLLNLPKLSAGPFAGGGWGAGMASDFLRSLTVMAIPTFFMGAAFPLAVRLCIRSADEAGSSTGALYGWNTLGAIAGSIAAAFIIVPKLGVGLGIFLLGCIYLLIGIFLAAIDPDSRKPIRVALIVLGLGIAPVLGHFAEFSKPFQTLRKGESLLYYNEGGEATVAVIQDQSGERNLLIDNMGVAGTNEVMQTDQKSLAHVPCLLHPHPQSVLTVGFGSGGASWSFTTHPYLKRIDCVEIAPSVLKASGFFKACNLELFKDSRYRVIIDDAKSYLLLSGRRYDIISTDCTDLEYRGNAGLYTADYFRLCKNRLEADGILVVWMPLKNLAKRDFLLALKSFQSEFPQSTVWYMHNRATHYILLVGFTGDPAIDWETLKTRIAQKPVLEDLKRIDLADPYRLLSCCILGPKEIGELLKGTREINSEDRPTLEFRVPRGKDPAGDLKNLRLVSRHASPGPVAINVPPLEAESFKAAFARHLEARPHIIRGHLFARSGARDGAKFEYERALAILPGDVALQSLLGISEARRLSIEREIEAGRGDGCLPRLQLALLYRDRGELEKALETIETARRLCPGYLEAEVALAEVLGRMGRWKDAKGLLIKSLGAATSETATGAIKSLVEKYALMERAAEKPGDIVLRLAVAEGLQKSGAPFQAISFLEKTPGWEREPQILDRLESICHSSGLLEDAVGFNRRLLAIDPGDIVPRLNLLDLYVRMEATELAKPEFQYLSNRFPDDPTVWFNGAKLSLLEGDADAAQSNLNRAVEIGGSITFELAGQDPLFKGTEALKRARKILR